MFCSFLVYQYPRSNSTIFTKFFVNDLSHSSRTLLTFLENDICTLGNWVADIEDELRVMNRLLIQIATRMGLK